MEHATVSFLFAAKIDRRYRRRMHFRCWRYLLVTASAAACLLTSCATTRPPLPKSLAGVKRVVMLGDSITHSGQYIDLIDAYFVTRFPQARVEWLNLGLPSETVSGLSEDGHADGKFPRPDLHERLERVLKKTRPDLVIACYGMNDGIYLPFSEERFAKFTNGMARLRESVATSGARIIHVTPPIFDEMRGKGPGYGNTLDRYADWMLMQRRFGWDVVDLHGPMNDVLVERRKENPRFFLAGDGVHPGDEGHWIMARQILLHLGAKDLAGVLDSSAILRGHPKGEALLKLVQQKQRLMRDAWLSDTGHQRPGMNKGLALPEAQAKAAELELRIRELAETAPATTKDARAPLIRKLGTVDLDMVETTPVVFRGRLQRFEWVRQGFGQQYWNNERGTNYFRFRDAMEGTFTAPFAEGHEFGSAFVERNQVFVTGTQGRRRVTSFRMI